MRKMKIGVVGCGNISGVYLQAPQKFPILDIVACADIDMNAARVQAEKYGIPRACTVDELLADPAIEIVVNLTPPHFHSTIDLAALQAGKHAYAEKPLAVSRADGKRIMELAAAKGLRVGSAPDTFLGGGIQTCRKLIDDGWIGQPIGAAAFMLGHGPEAWHPNPFFFYQPGAGPLFDMGPYYLTALVNLLGPVKSVAASATISFSERIATCKEHFGKAIQVTTPTHVNGILEFETGAVGTITTSFDVWACELPRIEVYGSEGTLSVPDPNTFGGPVRLKRAGAEGWTEMPLSHGYADQSRGIGAADMAYALQSGRDHRASGALAFHVLDIMESLYEAARARAYVDLGSRVDRPAPLPMGLLPGMLDE
ncbi:MAG: Gfo/Idh/MocA family oxidoreductase [Armatimonadetes bacterium]|nr:Gfo/Idh/MocA family oxidoreductase [Armatimonadota bacterium]